MRSERRKRVGDKRRFDLFAKLIQGNFSDTGWAIADVAGGKGYLQLALVEFGYRQVVTFDVRSSESLGGKIKYRHQFFGPKVKGKFDLIVGMHPDEATDVIIVEAAKRGIPFVVCPCCVKPSAVSYWDQYKSSLWLAHLKKLAERLGFVVTETALRMTGKNTVLIGRPAMSAKTS